MAHPAENAFRWMPGLTPAAVEGLRLATTETAVPSNLPALREHFASFKGLAFPTALDAGLLQQMLALCDKGTFVSDPSGPGHREAESPQRVGRALNLVFSRPPFLRWLEDVTGAGPLRDVEGRVVQTFPRPGDRLHWHDDCPEQNRRQLALVLNLSAHPFQGGEFELRRKGGPQLLQYQHSAPGTLLIFRVSQSLEHRVLPLQAGGPRRVYTAWAFAQEPR